MLSSFKINYAVIICCAFVFRVLFVNVGIISSLNTHQNKGVVKAHFSGNIKKRRNVDAPNTTGNYEYSATEICEEGADENNSSKSNPFLFTQVLNSLFAGKINSTTEKISPFLSYFSYPVSPRYLAFQVFRL